MISASFNSMGLTSLQVCMDSSDWLQGTIHDETGGMLDSSSSSPSSAGGDMLNLTCSSSRGGGGVALISERRLRPPHDQALKCPRCDSTHTKFCYYNNYSLSQPRYFCKTCRRYWTKGGTLRNIPVGGGCRKSSSTKKGNSSKNSSNDHMIPQNHVSSSAINNINPTEQQHLQLAFLNATNHHDQMQFPHFGNSILGNPGNNFYVTNNPTLPIDFLGNGEMGSVLNGDMMINSPAGIINPGSGAGPMNFHNLCSPFGMYLDGNYKHMLTYETNNHEDVKPNGKHLSLEWNDHHQGCSSDQVGNQVDSVNYDYFNGVGSSSWSGLMNGYGTSATNPLV